MEPSLTEFLTRIYEFQATYGLPWQPLNVVVAGPPQCGKTTLVRNLLGLKNSPLIKLNQPQAVTYVYRPLNRGEKDFREEGENSLKIGLTHPLLKRLQLIDSPADRIYVPTSNPAAIHLLYLLHQRGFSTHSQKQLQPLARLCRQKNLPVTVLINTNLGFPDGSSLEWTREQIAGLLGHEVPVFMLNLIHLRHIRALSLYLETIAATHNLEGWQEHLKQADQTLGYQLQQLKSPTSGLPKSEVDLLLTWYELWGQAKLLIAVYRYLKRLPDLNRQARQLLNQVTRATTSADEHAQLLTTTMEQKPPAFPRPLPPTPAWQHIFSSQEDRELLRLFSPPLVVLLGSFSTGKTSFIRSLLPAVPLATSDAPSTPCPVYFHYGPAPQAVVATSKKIHILNLQLPDGRQELLRLLHRSQGKSSDSRTEPVLYADVFYPDPFLQYLSLVDTPGYDAGELSAVHQEDALNFCRRLRPDIVLVFASGRQPFTPLEENICRELAPTCHLFYVINFADLFTSSERERLLISVRRQLATWPSIAVFFISTRHKEVSSDYGRLYRTLLRRSQEIRQQKLTPHRTSLLTTLQAKYQQLPPAHPLTRVLTEWINFLKHQDTNLRRNTQKC